MNKCCQILCLFSILVFSIKVCFEQSLDVLLPKEKANGRSLLFNGKNLEGWHTYLKDTTKAWQVQDGAIMLDPSVNGGDSLVTDSSFENFDLRLEWRISKGEIVA